MLNTVTYGLTCAPFLAIRTLLQLVKDEGGSFTTASYAIQNQTYVDDIVIGAYSLDSALQLQSELVNLLQRGGFSLKRWTSNSPDFLEHVPVEGRDLVHIIADSEKICFKMGSR